MAELTDCPECGQSVQSGDGLCASCGNSLNPTTRQPESQDPLAPATTDSMPTLGEPAAVAGDGPLHVDADLLDSIRETADEEILTNLATSGDRRIRRAVASAKNASPATLEVLGRDPDGQIRYAVSLAPNVRLATLRLLSDDDDGQVRESATAQLVQRAIATGEVTDTARLARDRDTLVRLKVAQTPGVAADILEILARDPAVGIRVAVAGNPSTSPGTLATLERDGNNEVRQAARKNGAPATRTEPLGLKGCGWGVFLLLLIPLSWLVNANAGSGSGWLLWAVPLVAVVGIVVAVYSPRSGLGVAALVVAFTVCTFMLVSGARTAGDPPVTAGLESSDIQTPAVPNGAYQAPSEQNMLRILNSDWADTTAAKRTKKCTLFRTKPFEAWVAFKNLGTEVTMPAFTRFLDSKCPLSRTQATDAPNDSDNNAPRASPPYEPLASLVMSQVWGSYDATGQSQICDVYRTDPASLVPVFNSESIPVTLSDVDQFFGAACP